MRPGQRAARLRIVVVGEQERGQRIARTGDRHLVKPEHVKENAVARAEQPEGTVGGFLQADLLRVDRQRARQRVGQPAVRDELLHEREARGGIRNARGEHEEQERRDVARGRQREQLLGIARDVARHRDAGRRQRSAVVEGEQVRRAEVAVLVVADDVHPLGRRPLEAAPVNRPVVRDERKPVVLVAAGGVETQLGIRLPDELRPRELRDLRPLLVELDLVPVPLDRPAEPPDGALDASRSMRRRRRCRSRSAHRSASSRHCRCAAGT